MNKIFIGTGSGSECKMSAYQNTLLYNFFIENNYQVVSNPNNSDIIMLNNCSFEEFEEKIALISISYYLQKYPDKKIYLIGCLPAMTPELSKIDRIKMIGLKDNYKFNKEFNINVKIEDIKVDSIRYFSPLNIEDLNIGDYGYKTIMSNYKYTKNDYKIGISDIKNNNVDISNIKEYNSKYNYIEDLSGDYFVEICQGCSSDCSYCIIRRISGYVKSYDLDFLINKIKRGVEKGYKFIHLISEDCGSYGMDLGIDISVLLNEINKIKGDFKVKICYYEPGRLLETFEKIDKSFFDNRLHSVGISMQSSSQRLLKLMNRNYDFLKVIEIVKKIKELNSDIFINTEFIYGFPSETFDEFLDYFRHLDYFDFVLFHYYSERTGTLASKLNGKLSKIEIFKRVVFLGKIIQKNDKINIKNKSIEELLNIVNLQKS